MQQPVNQVDKAHTQNTTFVCVDDGFVVYNILASEIIWKQFYCPAACIINLNIFCNFENCLTEHNPSLIEELYRLSAPLQII